MAYKNFKESFYFNHKLKIKVKWISHVYVVMCIISSHIVEKEQKKNLKSISRCKSDWRKIK